MNNAWGDASPAIKISHHFTVASRVEPSMSWKRLGSEPNTGPILASPTRLPRDMLNWALWSDMHTLNQGISKDFLLYSLLKYIHPSHKRLFNVGPALHVKHRVVASCQRLWCTGCYMHCHFRSGYSE